MFVSESRLVCVLLLTGWKSGARFLTSRVTCKLQPLKWNPLRWPIRGRDYCICNSSTSGSGSRWPTIRLWVVGLCSWNPPQGTQNIIIIFVCKLGKETRRDWGETWKNTFSLQRPRFSWLASRSHAPVTSWGLGNSLPSKLGKGSSNF